MGRKERRRREAEYAAQPALVRLLRNRYKYVVPLISAIIGACIGWLFGQRQAIALGLICAIFGFVIGFLLDMIAQSRNINRNVMRPETYWHGANPEGNDAPD